MGHKDEFNLCNQGAGFQLHDFLFFLQRPTMVGSATDKLAPTKSQPPMTTPTKPMDTGSSLASLFENKEGSGLGGGGFGMGGLLGIRGAIPKMPSFRVSLLQRTVQWWWPYFHKQQHCYFTATFLAEKVSTSNTTT